MKDNLHQSTPLTWQQVYHFLDEGWVLASGLIPSEIVTRADAAAWRCYGISPDEPEHWDSARDKGEFFDDPDLMSVYTDDVLRAAAQLGDNPTRFSHCRRPNYAFVIKLIPTPDEEWKPVGLHMDGASEVQKLEFAPAQWQMFAMIYLHDVESHAGGTVIWPRSHRLVESVARSDPERFRFLCDVRNEIFIGDMKDEKTRYEIGEPLEVSPRAGDVLFMHPLMLHAKPMNIGKRPRFAMHYKW